MCTSVTVSHDITLVTIPHITANTGYIANIFEKIAEINIDVDMITLSPVQGESTGLSFTINDNDLIKLLEYTSSLKPTVVKPIVSSGNHVICIFDKNMENNPGIAAKVFRALANVGAEISVISTSEVQIALLFTESEFDEAYSVITKIFK